MSGAPADILLAVIVSGSRLLAGCGAVPHAPAAVRAPHEQPSLGRRGLAADRHLVPSGGPHSSARSGTTQPHSPEGSELELEGHTEEDMQIRSSVCECGEAVHVSAAAVLGCGSAHYMQHMLGHCPGHG